MRWPRLDWFDVCMWAVFAGGPVALIIGSVWLALTMERSPTFTLYKAEWTCTESHQTSSVLWQYDARGMPMYPIVTYSTICDAYQRSR
jgi:hypothetical protein